MKNPWKNFIKKLDGTPAEKPRDSDWEKMAAKIGAQPALNTPARKTGAWFAAGAGLLAVAVVVFWLWPKNESVENVAEQNQYVPRENAIGNSKNFESENSEADFSISVKSLQNNGDQKVTNDFSENESEILAKNQTENDIVNPKEAIVSQTLESKSSVSNPAYRENGNPIADLNRIEEISSNSIDDSKVEKSDEVLDEDFNSSDTNKMETESSQKESKNEDVADLNFQSSDEDLPASFLKDENPENMLDENEGISNENSLEKEISSEENTLANADIFDEDREEKADDLKSGDPFFQEEKTVIAARDLEESLKDSPIVNLEGTDEKLETENLKLPTSESDVIILPGNGFRLSGLNLGLGYSTDFSPDFHGLGGGADLDFQRGNFIINAGFHFYRYENVDTQTQIFEQTDIRSSTFQDTLSREITRVDSAWIVTGPWMGGYRFDTTRTSADSLFSVTQSDTHQIKIATRETRRVRLSYAEMPILAGWRFEMNRFALDLQAGAVLHQLVESVGEGQAIEKNFGVDAVLRPGVRYYMNDRLSVFGRAGLRYGITPNGPRSQKFYGNFQLGVGFQW